MKIIWTDNYARESVAEHVVAEGIRDVREALIMLEALQANPNKSSSTWYKLVEDNYQLWRGMEELV